MVSPLGGLSGRVGESSSSRIAQFQAVLLLTTGPRQIPQSLSFSKIFFQNQTSVDHPASCGFSTCWSALYTLRCFLTKISSTGRQPTGILSHLTSYHQKTSSTLVHTIF